MLPEQEIHRLHFAIGLDQFLRLCPPSLGRIAVKCCNLRRKIRNLSCQEELADDVTGEYGPEFFQQILVLEVRVGNPRQERLCLHLINVDVIGAAVGKVHDHLLDIGVAFRVDGPERGVDVGFFDIRDDQVIEALVLDGLEDIGIIFCVFADDFGDDFLRTACYRKTIYNLLRIFTHQLVVVWISASSGSVRFFICASINCCRSLMSMALRAASTSPLAKV